MKYITSLIATVFCFTFFNVSSQVSLGFKAATSLTITPNANNTYLNRQDVRNEMAFNVVDAGAAISAGIFADLELNDHFFLRAEGLYTQLQTTYSTKFTNDELGRSKNASLYREKTKRLDVPVSIGVHLSNVEITSGFVTHFLLSNSNELEALEGFAQNLKPLQFGFQMGLGINISNVHLGLNYQMDFQNYADHISVNGTNAGLLNSPTRVGASVGFRF